MILIYECRHDLAYYARQGRKNPFPEIHQCPHCRAKNRLLRHGFYGRNAIDNETCYRILICRLKCPSCEKTFSLIPDFLIPYFQHTLKTVIQWIQKKVVERQRNPRARQLVRFYVKRFFHQCNPAEMFFREQGKRDIIPAERKEKAIKLLEMISAFGEAPFLRRSQDHFQHNFMAK